MMNDFIKTLTATIVGALIALVGTWYSTTQSAEKAYKAELRGRLDQLMTNVVRSDKCLEVFAFTGQESVDCKEPLWTSVTLAELYFDNLKQAVMEFQNEILESKLALVRCEPSGKFDSEKERSLKRLICVKEVWAKRNTDGKLEKIFAKAKDEIEMLKQ